MKNERTVVLRIARMEMPEKVGGTILKWDDDSVMIVINSARSADEQAAHFLHECLHLYHDDLNDPREANVIEAERREEMQRILALSSGKKELSWS